MKKRYKVAPNHNNGWIEIVEAESEVEALCLANRYHSGNEAVFTDIWDFGEVEKPATKRLSKPEYACLLALAASFRSEDAHTKCGAAIFDENFNTLGTGFNGLAPGMEVPEWMKLEENRTKKALLFTHAEANCLIKANWLKKPFYIAANINPCSGCAKLIVAAGIKQLYYISEYERGGLEWQEVFDFYSVKYEKIVLPVEISFI